MSGTNTNWSLELDGTDKDDKLIGSSGRDLIKGNGGNDKINGKAGNDRMYGGDGNDTFLGGEGKDYMDGGDGHDGVDYAQSGYGITVDLAAGLGWGGHAEGDRLVSIETVVGSSFDDVIKGSDSKEAFYGGKGNDSLFGYGGNDFLSGGRGVDKIVGGTGNDKMYGEGGNDYMSGGAGEDFMVGGAGHDRIAGGRDDDVLKGGGGNDALSGQSGSDKLLGGAAHDILRGGGGDDLLNGGRGYDKLDGGNGLDVAVFRGSSSDYGIVLESNGTLNVFGGPDGHDTLMDVEKLNFKRDAGTVDVADLFNTATETVTTDRPNKVQNVLGTTGNDVFEFSGDSSNFDWDVTKDGEGYVVWNHATGSHDVLIGFEAIRFDDATVRLTGTASEYADLSGKTQYLQGGDLTDRFLVDGKSSDYNVGPTLDGKDIVVWNDYGYDILYDFEEIRFNDTTVVIADLAWV